jgi:PEP-CTERM/exosortase A-associated glycosyltransferase
MHVTGTKHVNAASAIEQVDDLSFYRTLPTGGWRERLPVVNQLEVVRSLSARISEILRAERPDLLHAHSPSLNGAAAIYAAGRNALPVVYEIRALWEDGAVDQGVSREGDLRYRLTRGLETWVLKRAGAVTTICEGLRRNIVARGIPESKVTVIPNAVEVAHFTTDHRRNETLAAKLNLADKTVLGFIGSFYSYEGLSVLLDALPKILARHPGVHALIVGGGMESDSLKRQAARLNIENNVTFTGWVPHNQVLDYYSLMDIMVYPRRRVRVTELVTPLKPLEAMAQGKLVIASDVGGHRELIVDGQTGILFRADDSEALATAVIQQIVFPERARTIRAAARRFVEQERTWAASVGRYAAIYDGLTSRRVTA